MNFCCDDGLVDLLDVVSESDHGVGREQIERDQDRDDHEGHEPAHDTPSFELRAFKNGTRWTRVYGRRGPVAFIFIGWDLRGMAADCDGNYEEPRRSGRLAARKAKGNARDKSRGKDKGKGNSRGRARSRSRSGSKSRSRSPTPENVAYSVYDDAERSFYHTTDGPVRRRIAETEGRVAEMNDVSVPLRFRLLLSELDGKVKASAMKHVEAIARAARDGGGHGGAIQEKVIHWVDGLCSLPIGRYKSLPVDASTPREQVAAFLAGMRASLDAAVYGHASKRRIADPFNQRPVLEGWHAHQAQRVHKRGARL